MSILQAETILRLPEVSPLALMAVLVSKYSTDWITLEPEVLFDQISEDFGGLHPLGQEKVRALRVCATSKSPWRRFEVFSPVVRAFVGIPVMFNRHLVMSPHQLGLGMMVMSSLSKEVFTEEVAKYVAASLMTTGLHYIPIPDLTLAREFLRPFSQSAQIVFDNIKDVPMGDIELEPTTNDNVQAIKGRAELEAYRDTLSIWRDHIETAKRLV